MFGQGKPFIAISGIPSDHRIILDWLEPLFTGGQGGNASILICPAQDEPRAKALPRSIKYWMSFVNSSMP